MGEGWNGGRVVEKWVERGVSGEVDRVGWKKVVHGKSWCKYCLKDILLTIKRLWGV